MRSNRVLRAFFYEEWHPGSLLLVSASARPWHWGSSRMHF
jgi:hypothetical protein